MGKSLQSNDRDKSAHRVVVVGAGAAGMVAASEAAMRGAEVILLEKNRKAGVKILMSGGTRCNITQNTDAKGIAAAFGKAGRFLQKSVGAFPPSDVVDMFNRLGVDTKVESTGKVFPKSDRAIHVRDALLNRVHDAGVRLQMQTAVRSIQQQDAGWLVQTESDSIQCDKVIVTSGGKSWPGCGTTGDGYPWMHQLGHTIVKTRPALVPLVGGDRWMNELSGITLPEVTASVYDRDDWQTKSGKKLKPLVVRQSSWLFTHFGFSGPAAMDVSGVITQGDSFDSRVLVADLLPSIEETQLVEVLQNRGGAAGKRPVANVLADWLPTRVAESVAQISGADVTIAQLSKDSLRRIVASLKRIPMPVKGTRGFEKAEVTAGGVSLKEVDPRTLESRLHPGLHIAGELLDVDGWIGGYNFQAAFSTGRAAGIAAAEH
ncbi:NAD(P)/FAD-dependent oxidoreductase [Stieleria sp. JC731]|uniref:NAD(P)/FAD-dependent oxidoreductase n=1 Tax=Pirellulaceae TaxID=2691357 RepID=UPI001E4466EB|nr:NAD(P)/FAD-dependent oxidoreductase [Stieleria sp. JC731]MCC9603063.1 NAD(P)/FAD-dependent oxidoreductase [Stieleria sp. JC731]